MKKLIIGYILGILSCIAVVVIAESINSSEVLYDNSNSSSNKDNVQDVLDDMYNIIQHGNLGFSLFANSLNGISTELIGGLYRFQGSDSGVNLVNNHICFGTTDKNTCVGNTANYMYRIIGIDANGQMKLIKKEALDTNYQWNSSNARWPNSELFNGLNGSYFLTNTSLVPTGWGDRIAINPWHYYASSDNNSETILERELSAPTIDAKIGLIYLHDIKKSLGWVNSSGGWTITQQNESYVWLTYSGATGWVRSERAVYPSFYLRASERIASGSGTITDPYMLSA